MICYYLVQDEREVLPPNSEVTGAATAVTAASHGIEVAVEFKPVEHPSEPLDTDKPIQCPLPEPSILNVSSKLGVPSRMFCYTLQRVQADVCVCGTLLVWFALDRLVWIVNIRKVFLFASQFNIFVICISRGSIL